MEFFFPKRSLSVFISFDIFKCHGVLDIVKVVSKPHLEPNLKF